MLEETLLPEARAIVDATIRGFSKIELVLDDERGRDVVVLCHEGRKYFPQIRFKHSDGRDILLSSKVSAGYVVSLLSQNYKRVKNGR